METREQKPYVKIDVSKPKHSVVTIEVTVSPEELERHRKIALEGIKKSFRAPGFRDGHVPEPVVLQHVHEHHLLEEAAESAIREAYPTIIEDSKVAVASSPRVALKKLALGNPLEFTVEVGVQPEVKLPNYVKLAKKIRESEPEVEISAAEVDAVIEELRTMRTPEGGEKPELTDAFAKEVGPFENVNDLREKVRTNLAAEKTVARTRDLRGKVADALAAESKIEVSELAVDDEVASAMNEFESALTARKLTLTDYLKQAGKTEEVFVKEEKERAERRIKARLAIKEIAKEEKIEPKPEDIEHELSHAGHHFKDVNDSDLRAFVRDMLIQDLVLSFLESTGEKV